MKQVIRNKACRFRYEEKRTRYNRFLGDDTSHVVPERGYRCKLRDRVKHGLKCDYPTLTDKECPRANKGGGSGVH
jgi:hypothetical protein